MKQQTLLERALQTVPDFRQSYEKFRTRMIVEQKTSSTIYNYSSKISALCLYYNKPPEHISSSEIDAYLAKLLQTKPQPSLTQFKHLVYGLRLYYRISGLEREKLHLPSIKKSKKLPVILNYEECRLLFKTPKVLKHRVILSLIYSAGLRLGELCKLRISDIDSHRMLIHIRDSKYRKDRYVPLSSYILKGLRVYYQEVRPQIYLFNGYKKGEPISGRAVEWILRETCKKTTITKEINVHTLRHSFASHLLEMGVNVVQVQELLGHADVKTTLIYLHTMKPAYKHIFSPLDKLYTIQE